MVDNKEKLLLLKRLFFSLLKKNDLLQFVKILILTHSPWRSTFKHFFTLIPYPQYFMAIIAIMQFESPTRNYLDWHGDDKLSVTKIAKIIKKLDFEWLIICAKLDIRNFIFIKGSELMHQRFFFKKHVEKEYGNSLPKNNIKDKETMWWFYADHKNEIEELKKKYDTYCLKHKFNEKEYVASIYRDYIYN